MTANPKAKIMLVDDDKFILDVYGMKFSHAGYDIRSAVSVDDALKTLREGFTPDVMILDLVLNNASGLDLLHTIQMEHLAPGAYRIVLTNQSREVDKEQAEKLGADRFIIKVTQTPEEVVEIVDKALAEKLSAQK
jgi:DNA-binding NtrC family response regulator